MLRRIMMPQNGKGTRPLDPYHYVVTFLRCWFQSHFHLLDPPPSFKISYFCIICAFANHGIVIKNVY